MMIFGAFTLLAFYLPWAMLALDVIFGSLLVPDLLGIVAGHLLYFLTVLHPLAGGKNILKTPLWVHKVVAWFRISAPAPYRAAGAGVGTRTAAAGPAHPERDMVVFRGRAHRLND